MASPVAGADEVGAALFSFWSSPASTAIESFVGSGICIAPDLVLTAQHLFGSGRQLWARHNVGGVQAYEVQHLRRHPVHDVALVRVQTHDPRVRWLRCDRSSGIIPGQGLQARLAGFFEGRPEFAQELLVLNHDTAAQPPHFVTSVKHPVGHSGSGILVQGALWGLAVQHYEEANVHRGCVVALSQVWDELLADQRLVTAGSPAVPAMSQDAGIGPDTELCMQVTQQLKGLFVDDAPLKGWSWASGAVDGLPPAAVRAIGSQDRGLGGRLLRMLADDLVPALEAAIEEGSLVVDVRAAQRIRRGVAAAVDLAAKLCMDPQQRQALQRLAGCREVPSEREVAAALALLTGAIHALEPIPGHPAQKARHRYAVSHGLEHGEGDDQRYGLASRIASLQSSRNHTTAPIVIRTPEELADWRSYLRNERDRNRGRILLLGKAERHVLGEDTERWLDDFGVTVVALVGDSTGFYWFDEGDLVGKVQSVLSSFAEHTMWKGTHAS